MDAKTQLLFCSAAQRVALVLATPAYLLSMATRFAKGFEGDAESPLFYLYAKRFAESFRPGMDVTPVGLLERAKQDEAFARSLYEGETKRATNGAVRPEIEAAMKARRAREQAAIEERQAREAAASRSVEQEASKVDAVINSTRYTDLPTSTLRIDGRAKNAYIKAGLETVGEIETYAQSRPLDTVKGVGEDFAKATLIEIERLKNPEGEAGNVDAEDSGASSDDSGATGEEEDDEQS